MNTRSTLIRMALAIVVIAAGRTSSTAQEQKPSEGVPNPAAKRSSAERDARDASICHSQDQDDQRKAERSHARLHRAGRIEASGNSRFSLLAKGGTPTAVERY